MKAVLIRAPEDDLHDDRLDPPLGLMYLGAAVADAGHDVEIVDLAGARPLDEIPEGDLYGISAFTTSYHVALKILAHIRAREPDAVVVAGGPHVSAVQGRVLGEGFDYAFVGEGELTFPRLLEDIATRKHDERLIFGREVAHIDELRFDYSLVDLPSYTRTVEDRPCATFLSARGCPFRCRFCWTPNNFGTTRFHSADYVRRYCELLEDEYGITAITFHDDSFLADKERALAIMDVLAEMEFIWRAECNVLHLVDPDLCERLAETGCRHVLVGVESGSAEILKAMKKPQSKKTIERGIKTAVEAGLVVRASLIIGFPGETWDTVRESADFLCELPFQEYSLYNFTPFPGTEPYEHPERFGIQWISDDYEDFYLLKGFNEANYSYRTDTITPELLQDWRAYLIERLNERHTPSVVAEGRWTIAAEK